MAIKNPFQYLYYHIKSPWNLNKLQTSGDQKLYDALNRIVDQLQDVTPTTVRYIRTLLIKDSTVGVNIADAPVIQNDGIPFRVSAVLKTQISAPLVININVNGLLLIQCTIPNTAKLLTAIDFTNFSITSLQQDQVLTADIISSDGLIVSSGIASFTLEWQ